MFSEIKGVFRHAIIYGSGGALSKVLGLILLPLYTYYLSPAEYGVLELLELTSYVVGSLLAMGITQAITRFYYDYDDKKRKNQAISGALIAISTITLLAVFWLNIFSKQISLLVLKSVTYSHLFSIAFFTLFFTLTNEICLMYILVQQKSITYTIISFLKLLLMLSLNLLFIVHFKMGVKGIIYSNLIASGVVDIYLFYYTFNNVGFSISFKILRDMMKYGLPLVGSYMAMFIVNFGDRFLLQRLASLTDVGIYSLAYKFGMISNTLILTPFMLIWAPKRFELAKQPNFDQIYKLIFTYLCFILIFFGLGISILVKDVLKLLSTPQFYKAYKIVPLIALSYVFWGVYSYVQFGILLRKKTGFLTLAVVTSAFLNILTNFVLIPKFHQWGAALATLISFVFLFVFTFFISQKLYYTQYETKRLLKMCIVGLCLFFTASLLNLSSVPLSLLTKFVMVLCFPVVLYYSKFYNTEELRRVKDALVQVSNILKAYLRVKKDRLCSVLPRRNR